MVNWSDPAEITRDSDAFIKIIFALFGVQMWELFMTWGFEWSLITRRRRFRWPLISVLTDSFSVFFFLSRYCMLFSFIGLIISITISHPVHQLRGKSADIPARHPLIFNGSQALFTFNSWTGNMAILCASTSLMLRTIALWERKRSIVISLGLLSLAHWTLLYRDMFVVHVVWDHDLTMCVVVSTDSSLLNVTFFFTMGFDFVILCTTAVALMGKHSARTDLWRLLFTDGLVYFLVTFSMNCVPAVLNLLNLNCKRVIHPTRQLNRDRSIAACRAVMRLLDYNSDVYVHSMAAVMPSSDPRHSSAPFSLPNVARFALTRPEGVLVTTEHITMSEFP
ncbi:hypothetical protein DFH07DRAFT_732907 [Mycena maculata]|uniref:Uncharacterized protein n=1 Tax=Mycena maculata TaxID=230809 RepID=A0AAD7K0K8_9AGAR|nr:hypothetical protein DFH07DRAFT_732907 [Mycena maculata]